MDGLILFPDVAVLAQGLTIADQILILIIIAPLEFLPAIPAVFPRIRAIDIYLLLTMQLWRSIPKDILLWLMLASLHQRTLKMVNILKGAAGALLLLTVTLHMLLHLLARIPKHFRHKALLLQRYQIIHLILSKSFTVTLAKFSSRLA